MASIAEQDLARQIFARQMARPGAVEGVVLDYIRAIFSVPLDIKATKMKHEKHKSAEGSKV
jgi:hypothetical protein